MADNTNAYATIQPLQANVSDWVNNQEIMGARQREEQRRIAELDRLAKEREQKKKDAQLERFKSIKAADPTGISSIDGAQRAIMEQAMDKRLELYKKQYAGQQLTPEEESLYQKLDNVPDMLALWTKSFKDVKSNYLDEVNKGKRERDLKYELAMEKMADGAIAFLDDEGNPAIGIDDNGDGKPDVISYDPSAGFTFKPRYIPSADFNSVIEGISKRVEASVNQTDNNFLKTKTTGVAEQDAEAIADGVLFGQNGVPTETAVGLLYKEGVDPENITEKDLLALKDKMKQAIILAEARGKVQNKDNAGETSRMSENRQAKKEEEPEYSLNDLYHATVTKENGVPVRNNYQGKVNITRKVGSAVESFSSFGLDNNGNVVVTVDVSTPKYTDAAIESMTSELEGEERIKREEELRQVQQITKKTYNEKQADDVTFYVQRFKNPRTKKYVEDIHEMKRELKSRGQDELGEPTQTKVQKGSYDDLE